MRTSLNRFPHCRSQLVSAPIAYRPARQARRQCRPHISVPLQSWATTTRFGGRGTPQLHRGRAKAHFDRKVGGMISGTAPGPIESWYLLERTPLRHLQSGTGVAIVEGERFAVAHDLLAADEHMPY